MSRKFDMSDYVPVNERVEAFIKEYPMAACRSRSWSCPSAGDHQGLRLPHRRGHPAGIGHSSLEIPGGTPYTKGSRSRTPRASAWGRAIAALGFEVNRGMASAEEAAISSRGRGARIGPKAAAAGLQAPGAGRARSREAPGRGCARTVRRAIEDSDRPAGHRCGTRPAHRSGAGPQHGSAVEAAAGSGRGRPIRPPTYLVPVRTIERILDVATTTTKATAIEPVSNDGQEDIDTAPATRSRP